MESFLVEVTFHELIGNAQTAIHSTRSDQVLINHVGWDTPFNDQSNIEKKPVIRNLDIRFEQRENIWFR